MKIRHLQILVAVVERRGISKASAYLNVTQPAVSTAIRSLEEELGVTLFERGRSSKGIRPTARAMRLYEHARDILKLCDEARRSVKAPDKRPPKACLGVLRTLAPTDIAAAHSALLDNAAKWRWSVREAGATSLNEAIDRRQLDVAWTAVDRSGTHSRVLWREPFAAMVSKNHPLAKSGRRSIQLKDLRNEPMVLRSRCELPRNTLRDAGLSIRPAAYADRDDLALALVAQGLGFAIAPRGLATSAVAALPVDDLGLSRSIGLRWHEETPNELVDAVIVAATR